MTDKIKEFIANKFWDELSKTEIYHEPVDRVTSLPITTYDVRKSDVIDMLTKVLDLVEERRED